MPAIPADIAEFTSDGVVVSAPATPQSDAIRAAHLDARDLSGTEIPMFFDLAADAQAMLDERATYLTAVNTPHEAVETARSLGIGTVIPITGVVPSFGVVDDERGIATTLRLRAFVDDMTSDRYSLELI